MREPLDTDREIPVVLKRDTAAARLLELLGPELANAVWDEIVAPLYDARTMTIGWTSGACRRCQVTHPALWGKRPYSAVGDRPWPGHRQRCPKYVGPVEHQVTGGAFALLGWQNFCSCGKSWYQYDQDGNRREECPEAAESWRGPVSIEGGEQR